MQKWEYTVLVTGEPVVQEMNNLGEEGWDVFNLEVDDRLMDDDYKRIWRIYAKRPKVD